MSVYYAYALYAGRQLLPCYIGIGKAARLHQHMSFVKRGDSKRGNLRKFRTLSACWRKWIPVRAERLVSNLSLDQACAIERVLITIYGRRDLGTGCLLNASAGGSGVRLLAQSTIARLAEAGRRHLARPDIRAMMNDKKRSPDARAKLSASKKGYVPTPEARAKMSASCRARNQRDPNNWEKFLASRKPGGFGGSRQSDEARRKISEALRAQWADPVLREKRSAFFKNPKSNPAQRERTW